MSPSRALTRARWPSDCKREASATEGFSERRQSRGNQLIGEICNKNEKWKKCQIIEEVKFEWGILDY